MAREKIEADEVSFIHQVGNRERPLKASMEQAEAPKTAIAPLPEEPEEVKEQEAPREETKRRRGKAQDYKSLFVKEVAGGKARVNKVVYIRKEHHDRILKVVQVIGKNEVSLFSFLDNVLEHHFSTFQGELSELYESSIDKSF
ncbi:hypothetical protein AGMMS50239_00250 [Bacteroidia bacterium]|jgi:hypothetical protein|nr:hypothetical protein AGMMS49574_16080 [Bacteroidia bacterium]GHT57609.1 hypothetical protein AGMMS50239_00250 [Bacteroidia bacterium]GHU88942.1 hypothetical protein FACS1894155_04830 [Bacteroidia bacterium]GHV14998.1 hypothetical protein FACS1894169_05130 [Bacteroidia bacterium]